MIFIQNYFYFAWGKARWLKIEALFVLQRGLESLKPCLKEVFHQRVDIKFDMFFLFQNFFFWVE
jgi:hypothetical protein